MKNELDKNPFNIAFGKTPFRQISRAERLDEVLETFSSENPASEVFILTGPRGCGKTVAMTELANIYVSKKNWIVVDLNPQMDLLEQLASKIYDKLKTFKFGISSEFSFSFSGITFSIKGEKSISNISTLIGSLLLGLKKKGINVLITIDEVVNNEHMRIFAHEFQSIIRSGFKCFLLATGLYENISSLEDEKSLTFLYRAPKIFLDSLSLRGITTSYQEIFGISYKEANDLAKITKGFAFAYQLLGYLLFRNKTNHITKNILDEFDDFLENRVYLKIWQSVSEKEKEILKLISNGKNTNKDIIDALNIQPNSLAVYKKRLSNKGIVDTSSRGLLKMKLPRFENFVLFNFEE